MIERRAYANFPSPSRPNLPSPEATFLWISNLGDLVGDRKIIEGAKMSIRGSGTEQNPDWHLNLTAPA